jgi:hypothetical protein
MPNPATPKLRDLAQRLLAFETVATPSPDGMVPAVFRVCNKLREPLTTFAGLTGFRTLLMRALTLAAEEVPALNNIQITPDGFLRFSGETQAPLDLDGSPCGEIILVAQLLGLLVAFIGRPLTLRLLQHIWPEPLAGFEFKAGKNYE